MKEQEKATTKTKKYWYGLGNLTESSENWGSESQKIIEKAQELGLDSGVWQIQGCRTIYAYCSKQEVEDLIYKLGKDTHAYWELEKIQIDAIKKIHRTKEREEKKNQSESKKANKLDDILKKSIADYNMAYTTLSDHGSQLFNQRERSIDLLNNVENLINSIANHPKDFDATIAEIGVRQKEFRDVCDFAKKELEAAQKSAIGAGAGIAGGAAVAALAPSAAM